MKILNPKNRDLDLLEAWIKFYYPNKTVFVIHFDPEDTEAVEFVKKKLVKYNLDWTDHHSCYIDGIVLLDITEDDHTTLMKEFDESQPNCPYCNVYENGICINENT